MDMRRQLFALLMLLSMNQVFSQAGYVVGDKVKKKAIPFLLSDVRVTGGVLKHAMDGDEAWLLSLEPERFMHRFRTNAGLTPKAEGYGGWEAAGVSGHSLGHYLSACSQLYAATGDARLKEKVDYIVSGLAECQAARGTGYVGAIPDEDKIWNEVAAGNIHTEDGNLNGAWVPWYTEHKVLAGLIDSWIYTGNKQAKEVAIRLCDWIDFKFKGLTDTQWQEMLNAEHGGMNEALANMYSITGDVRYLALSHKFHHKKILDPLADGIDVIHGVHANTQIPKIIGCARRYELTGDEHDRAIASNFWDLVVHQYSYVVGGNSDHERFAPKPGKLSGCLSATTTETCNSYNMLKLTGHLFEADPKASYMDFYERTLYNHILASQNPENGMVLYYLPLASGSEKKFGSATGDFWCCTGTGMENHTKYGKDIYYKSSDGGLYVNLFISSTLQWKEKGARLEMSTSYPESSAVNLRLLDIRTKGGVWPLYIRRPWWAKEDVRLSINGKPVTVNTEAGKYIKISRAWKKGDILQMELPMSLYTESMPDDSNMRAVMYGPLVLAGRLGKEPVRKRDIPVFVSTPAVMKEWIKPAPGDVDEFIASSNDRNIELSPLYKIYNERYAVYWNFFSAGEWKAARAKFDAERKAEEELEHRTLDIMRIGEMQPERDHYFRGERTNTGEVDGIRWRDAVMGGWFSFTLDTKGATDAVLQCTYWGGDGDGRVFDISIDDQRIATERLKAQAAARTYTVDYPVSADLLKGKNKVTVTFKAHPGKTAGGLFGCRLLRSDGARASDRGEPVTTGPNGDSTRATSGNGLVPAPGSVIPLYYPDSIPNSIPHVNEEERRIDEKGVELLSKISRPTLTIFLPSHVEGNKHVNGIAQEPGNIPAVVICPGGGYWVNAVNIEGYDEAKVLNSWGVAAFVLTYRIPDSAYCIHPEIAPLQDAQQAILQVRRHAAEWHIDPRRVGIMGFSAGGHLASCAGTHFDKVLVPDPDNVSVRPDWMILGYPVISGLIEPSGSFDKLLGKNPPDSITRYFSNETRVTDSTPPAFLVHAQDDDGVPSENSILFYQALTSHHIPAELHLYEKGGHGFGLHLPQKDEQWMDRCRHWMQVNGWLH
jgi:DUF1680 family protein/acetyl esterase/lipase